MKIKITILNIIFVILSLFCLFSCSNTKYYTIIYETNGGFVTNNNVKVEVGKEYILDEPIYEGFVFKGWYKDNNYKRKTKETVISMHQQTLRFYALWQDENSYNIELEKSNAKKFDKAVELIAFRITLDETQNIINARNIYESLTESERKYVTKYDDLLAAEAKLDELNKKLRDEESVIFINECLTQLTLIVDDTNYLTVKKTIEEIEEKYSSISNDILIRQIKNYDKLSLVKDALNSYETNLNHKNNAQVVIDLINNLPNNLSLNDYDAIMFAKSCYDLLLEEEKIFVNNIDKLEQAQCELIVLLENEENKKIAKQISDLIATIPDNITLDDEKQITSIRIEYNNLSKEVKQYITNLDKLLNAEKTIKVLRKEKSDNDAVEKVIKLIDDLPDDITLNDYDAIYNARLAYGYLTDELKTRITNYNKLVDSQKAYKILSEQAYKIAQDIDTRVSKLPIIIDYSYKEEIDDLYKAYDSLPLEIKKSIVCIDRLLNVKSQLDEITNNATVAYVLGNDIFRSREELYTSFFSDFYYFLQSTMGANYLKNNGCNSVDDFLKIGKNWNAGRGEMRALGDTFGSKMLTKDVNGILENQPTSTFYGYCYKNGKYVDFLEFAIKFFAFWRIDEKYANTSNYGADTFAEGWAVTVDLCKFFYFNADTSYVKTSRMKDCFNYTSSVCYGDLPNNLKPGSKLPSELKLRGYRFVGWYDNPEFNGDAVLVVPEEFSPLYAKWELDNEQKQKDYAELVDVYIYNLTTKRAIVSNVTVEYVVNMYNSLNTYGKSLVNKYETLKNYQSIYCKKS